MGRKILVVVGLVLFLSGTSVFALDMPGFGKKSAAPSGGGVTIEELKKNFDDIHNKYYENVTKHYLKSNVLALEAFGMKQEAEKLKAESGQMGSGVTTESLEKISVTRSEATAKISEKIKSGEKLSSDGKKLFSESMLELAKGILGQPVYVKGTKDIGQSAVESAKKASPMDAPKFNEIASGTTKLGALIVADGANAQKTLGIYMDYAKSNQIDVPADVTEAFNKK